MKMTKLYTLQHYYFTKMVGKKGIPQEANPNFLTVITKMCTHTVHYTPKTKG